MLECEDGAGFLRPVQRGLQLREEVSVVRLWLVLGSRRARLLRWPRLALLSSPSSRLLLLLLEGGIQRLQVPLFRWEMLTVLCLSPLQWELRFQQGDI